jgi:hypothetical protein
MCNKVLLFVQRPSSAVFNKRIGTTGVKLLTTKNPKWHLYTSECVNYSNWVFFIQCYFTCNCNKKTIIYFTDPVNINDYKIEDDWACGLLKIVRLFTWELEYFKYTKTDETLSTTRSSLLGFIKKPLYSKTFKYKSTGQLTRRNPWDQLNIFHSNWISNKEQRVVLSALFSRFPFPKKARPDLDVLIKQCHDLNLKFVIEEKLDGVCGFSLHSGVGDITMISKANKSLTIPQMLIDELRTIHSEIKETVQRNGIQHQNEIIMLAGELIIPYSTRDRVSGLLRRSLATEEHDEIKYVIFDITLAPYTIFERIDFIHSLESFKKCRSALILNNRIYNCTPERGVQFYSEIQKKNGEGVIVKLNSTSNTVYKYKGVEDLVLECYSYVLVHSNKKPTSAVLLFKQPVEFKAMFNPGVEVLRELLKNNFVFVGAKFNVEYFGLNSNGTPIHPQAHLAV